MTQTKLIGKRITGYNKEFTVKISLENASDEDIEGAINDIRNSINKGKLSNCHLWLQDILAIIENT